jgi:hypothetical protein
MHVPDPLAGASNASTAAHAQRWRCAADWHACHRTSGCQQYCPGSATTGAWCAAGAWAPPRRGYTAAEPAGPIGGRPLHMMPCLDSPPALSPPCAHLRLMPPTPGAASRHPACPQASCAAPAPTHADLLPQPCPSMRAVPAPPGALQHTAGCSCAPREEQLAPPLGLSDAGGWLGEGHVGHAGRCIKPLRTRPTPSVNARRLVRQLPGSSQTPSKSNR